jgi:hypothetical protein
MIGTPASVPLQGATYRRWLREPLVRFLALGVLIFAVDRLATRSAADTGIELDPRTREEQRAIFTQRQGRPPNEREAAQLAASWVEDELLFREGVRLDLVQRDPALREQIVARMRTLLASAPPVEPQERELRAFYEARRADYVVPDTVSFREWFVPAGPRADEIARELVRAISAGQQVALLPMRHEARSEAQLLGSHGPELASRIMTLPVGALQILRSSRGVHAIAIELRAPRHEPSFDSVRPTLRADLQAAQRQRAFADELAQLRTRYGVRE